MNLSPFPSKNFTTISHDWSLYPGLECSAIWEQHLSWHVGTINHFMLAHKFLPVALVVLYFFAIGYLKHWMLHRPPFSLRVPLILWNSSLAAFSIFGTVRVWPELIWTIQNRGGIRQSMCDDNYIDDPRLHLWIHLFSLSKIIELGDTVFIVLRKQRLLTLHWIHHLLTLLYCWYSIFSLPANSRWFCSMNFLIHSAMYSYYAAMAAGLPIPRWFAQALTASQIAQMAIGMYANILALGLGFDRCRVSFEMAFSGFVMYLIYLVLFVQFFIDKYIRINHKRKYKLN